MADVELARGSKRTALTARSTVGASVCIRDEHLAAAPEGGGLIVKMRAAGRPSGSP